MNRRELLKAVAALPAIPLMKGVTATKLEPGRYLILVHERSGIDADNFMRSGSYPGVHGEIHYVFDGCSVEDAVRIYKLSD
jgi:hypothetical protein